MPGYDADIVVVGAGIVGLAVARELLLQFDGLSVIVMEREGQVAEHQTGHNSGVIHGGIYYEPGSLKAQLCVEGSRLMYDFCDEQGIAYERCGKLIVALSEQERRRLDELHRRGQANGVPGLRLVQGGQLQELEPLAAGIAALHAPGTGIVDYRAVARSLTDDLRSRGARISLGATVDSVEQTSSGCLTKYTGGAVRSRYVIACAGLYSDRLAKASGDPVDPRIVPFRGAYLRLHRREPRIVRSMIYPVPDPTLPFLGVHVTPQISGDVVLGPTAIWMPSRNAYDKITMHPADVWDCLTWPGTWRVARRFWRTGVHELAMASSRRRFVAEAARYVPGLGVEDLDGTQWAGIRAQAVSRGGRLVDDFLLSTVGRITHVRNAPSPAATSSLALAREIVWRALDGASPDR
jgi:L-2-hydroxyglutarate oxidase LhgO